MPSTRPWLALDRLPRIPAATSPGRRVVAIIAGALLSQLAMPALAASLLFDHAVYGHPDCLVATLSAPGLDLSSRPSLSLVALHGGHPTHRLVVPLAERTPGSAAFETEECVALGGEAKPGAPLLRVAPGDVIVGLARDVRGQSLAVALASVAGGSGSGSFRAELDPTLTPPPVSSGVDRARVATLVDPQGRRAAFIDNEIVVQETKPGLLKAILSRYGGRVLSTVRIPGAPKSATVAPPERIYHVLEVDPTRVPASGFELLVERLGGSDVQGVWRYSSREAIRLLALVGYEALAGTSVSVNAIAERSAYPASNEGSGGNAFSFNWLAPGGPVRAGEALAFAHLLKLGSSVPVAFIDGGFAGPGDYSPSLDNPDYGVPFNSIVQCYSDSHGSVGCSPGAAGGPVDPNDPWHGTAVFSTAGAVLNNAFGAAGIGAEVVEPRFYKNELTLTSLAAAIQAALNPPVGLGPPRIINISQGLDCKVLLVDACDPLIQKLLAGATCLLIEAAFPELAVLGCSGIAVLALTLDNDSALIAAITSAAAKNVVVVASAGNSSEDVNSALTVPCTIFPAVCVGALDNQPFGAASFSNFGAEVRVWAPGTNLVTTPDPITSPNNALFSGTSASAPFVSGSLALAMAIAPKLTWGGALTLLFASNCKSGGTLRVDGTNCSLTKDPKVDTRGYLDVLELVRRARLAAGRPHLSPCTGGFGKDEKSPGQDSASTALALTPLPLMAGLFPYIGDGDHAIHDLTTTPPGASDDDWYQIKFATAIADVGFHVDFELPVPDPTLGSLQLQLWAATAGPPVAASHVSMNQPSGANGRAVLQAILRTDTTYLLQVTTVAPVAQNTNCYSSLQVSVGDRVKVCVPSPFTGGCSP